MIERDYLKKYYHFNRILDQAETKNNGVFRFCEKQALILCYMRLIAFEDLRDVVVAAERLPKTIRRKSWEATKRLQKIIKSGDMFGVGMSLKRFLAGAVREWNSFPA